MEQNKNIFQKIGDFIEAKGYSWIIPSKKESLSEAGTHFLSMLLLIPVFFIVLAVRLIIIVFKLFISLFHDPNKDDSSDSTSLLNKNIAKTILIGLLISCIIVVSIRILHNSARNTNVLLRNNRWTDCFMTYSIENVKPEDFILESAFDAINTAMQKDYMASEVVRLRKQLYIDDDFAKEFRFTSSDDFIKYLYSIKEIDKGVKPFINEADDLAVNKTMLDYYQQVALNEFENGNYYNASAAVEHFFNIYSHQKVFPHDGVNNKMHLMKLLLQQKWILTTNREFANAVFMSFGYYDCQFGDLDNLYFYCDWDEDQPFLKSVANYFDGLLQFHDKNYISALGIFESCFENTTDSLLRQYCSLMAIRSVFWNYDTLREDQALNLYRETYEKYAPYVTLDYFISDLKRYQSVVTEIINNPDYTGY